MVIEQAAEIGLRSAIPMMVTREALIESLEANDFETWRGPIRFERGEEHWHRSSPEVLLMRYQTVGQSFDDAVVVAPEDAATGPYRRPGELA